MIFQKALCVDTNPGQWMLKENNAYLWEVWAWSVNAHCGGHTFCSIYVCFVLSTPKNKQQGPVLKIEKVEEISLPFEAILYY